MKQMVKKKIGELSVKLEFTHHSLSSADGWASALAKALYVCVKRLNNPIKTHIILSTINMQSQTSIHTICIDNQTHTLT